MRCAVALLLALAAAWGAAQDGLDLAQETRTAAGGLLRVESGPLAFRLAEHDFPVRDAPIYPATAGSPIRLRVAVPTPATWFVSVGLRTPPMTSEDAAVLASLELEVRTRARGGSGLPGCADAPEWIPVGAGVLLAALEGPGTCELEVEARLRGPGSESPGTYRGTLVWTMEPER